MALFYLALILFLRIALDYSFLVPMQSATGGVRQYSLDVDVCKLVLSYVVLVALIAVMPKRRDASSIVAQLGFVYIYLPMGSVYALTSQSTVFFLASSMAFFVVFAIEPHMSGSFGQEIGEGFKRLVNSCLIAVAAIATVATIALMTLSLGLPSLTALDLSQVYEVRQSVQVEGPVSKLLIPVAKCALPLLLVFFFLRKRYALCAFVLLAELALYLWTGNKSWLFLIFVVLAALLVYRENRARLLLVAYVALVVLCIALELIAEEYGIGIAEWPFSLFIRRAMYIPAFLKFSYYDFFAGNPIQGLWGTMLAPLLVGVPPQFDIEHTIGYLYMGNAETYANTGMFGAEYAAFGGFGIFLAALLFLLFLWVVRVCATKNGSVFAVALALPMLITFCDASLLKTIVSPYGVMTLSAMLFIDLSDGPTTDSGCCVATSSSGAE